MPEAWLIIFVSTEGDLFDVWLIGCASTGGDLFDVSLITTGAFLGLSTPSVILDAGLVSNASCCTAAAYR